jgi:hypothetical protein
MASSHFSTFDSSLVPMMIVQVTGTCASRAWYRPRIDIVEAPVKFFTMASSRSIPASVSEIATSRLPPMLQVSLSWCVPDFDLVISFGCEMIA